MKWKHLPRHWPFIRGIHPWPVDSSHCKGQWRRPLIFSLICVWTNGWVNNRDAGDLRRRCAHYDVTVMFVMWMLVSPHVLLCSILARGCLPSKGNCIAVSIEKSDRGRCEMLDSVSRDTVEKMGWETYGKTTWGTDIYCTCMMTSSNGNIFHVTDPLWGESAGHPCVPPTRASDTELWCFLLSAPQQTVEQTIETPVIWDATASIMTSLVHPHIIGKISLIPLCITRLKVGPFQYKIYIYGKCPLESGNLGCFLNVTLGKASVFKGKSATFEKHSCIIKMINNQYPQKIWKTKSYFVYSTIRPGDGQAPSGMIGILGYNGNHIPVPFIHRIGPWMVKTIHLFSTFQSQTSPVGRVGGW